MIKLEVIGDPIEHSLSPAVHGAALDALGISYEYAKIRVLPGGLKEYIDHAFKDGINGFNLTMPHKVDIIRYLAGLSEDAEVMQSVNTVCVRDKKLYGYNTDGIGFEMSLNRSGYEFGGSRIVIFGAGGVVRTLAAYATKRNAKSVCILNRTVEKAEDICLFASKISNEKDGIKTEFKSDGADKLFENCANADIFINATPLGMSGVKNNFEEFDFLKALPKGALVADLIYNPPKTALLQKADSLGFVTQNGLGMLIFQALAAEEYYLDRKIDMQAMYEKVAKSPQVLKFL